MKTPKQYSGAGVSSGTYDGDYIFSDITTLPKNRKWVLRCFICDKKLTEFYAKLHELPKVTCKTCKQIKKLKE